MGFAVTANHRRKQKERQIPGPCQRGEKAEEYENNGDNNYSWKLYDSSQMPW